jgi:hypothetical protein
VAADPGSRENRNNHETAVLLLFGADREVRLEIEIKGIVNSSEPCMLENELTVELPSSTIDWEMLG